MKTLILLLAASLTAPAFAQSDADTTTTTRKTVTKRTYRVPSSSSDQSSRSSQSSQSSFGQQQAPSSAPSSAAISEQNRSAAPSSDTATAGSSAYETQRSAGSTSAPSATSPSMAAPGATSPSMAAPAPTATAASEETTSRTYHEEMGGRERKASGFYIEPALVGTREDADITGSRTVVGTDTTGTNNGFGADLKLGGHLGEVFFLAADGRYERTRFADSSYSNQDSNTWNWGPTVGLQAPWAGMRVWGTYIVDGMNDPEAGANGVDLRFKDPYGWRAGVGFRLSAVSLNVEYEDLTYRTTDIQSVGTVAAAGSSPTVDFAQRGYSLSLSFPIEL